MPAAAFIVPAVASLGAAAIASRGQGKGADAQERSTREALAFEREREATRRNEYDRTQAQAQKQWEARDALRLALMKRYGMNVPAGATAQPGQMRASGLTLASLSRPQQTPQALPAAPPGASLASLRDWHNWGGR